MTDAAPRLEITLLGGFAVSIGGQVVPDAAWRQRRAAAVVKLLALAPNHYLHREQIIDTLWPDLDPEPAANNLRVALHHARRQLRAVAGDAAGDFLVRDGDGLRLGPPGRVAVDVDDFEATVAAIWRTADFGKAAKALARYHGDLLPEDRYEDWVADRRTALQTSYVTLLARSADWHEERAELDRAIAARQQQVAAEPLDEPAHAALMRLYARAGQPRHALDQYARLSARLERELGAEPERETRELLAAIRDGSIPATPPPPPPAPEPEPPLAGIGLPAPVDELIGRDRELAELRHLLRASRLLVLTGPGGVGKTRLAVAVARTVAGTFPGGASFVDLAPLVDPDLVLPAIARAAGVREVAGEPLFESVAARLGEARHLLLVDNVEHLIGAAPVLGELLAACAGLTVLATSRARLRLRGEQEYPVQPLAVLETDEDGRGTRRSGTWSRAPAVALFTRRAREARPDFELHEDNAAAVRVICRRLDGLPLALEMAAARVRVLPPLELARRLEQPLAVLDRGPRDAPARQQTLRATIAWSHDLLAPDERALFAGLAVFAGGATLDAVEAIAAEPGDGAIILDGVAALVDASLLRQETGDTADQARLSMLQTIRDYARERLAATGVEDEVRQRHAAYFLALAEDAAPALTGAEQVAWLDRLEQEHANLRAALTTFDRTGQPALTLRLAAALWRFWWTRGYLTEGRRWLDLALAAAETGEERTRATALDGDGALAEAQGELATAAARHEAALAIWRRLDDLPGQMRSLMNLGLVADVRGEPARAVRLYEEALLLGRRSGDQAGIAGCLANLGFAALDQGDHGQAAAYFGESLHLFRARGDRRNLAAVLDGLGILAFLGGDYAAAATLQAEALDHLRDLGDRQGTANALANLGHTTQRLGDHDQAERLYADALDLYRELGDQSGIAFVLTHLGRLARWRGDPGRAEALLRESFHLAWSIGERIAVIEAMEGLATVALDRGDAEQTARLLGAAGSLRDATGVPLPEVHQAEHRHCLATARSLLGDGAFEALLTEGRTLLPEQVLPALAGRH